MKQLTLWEEVGPGSILTDVEVFPELAAGFKAEHGVVMQAVVPEQHDAARLQHLYSTCKEHTKVSVYIHIYRDRYIECYQEKNCLYAA